MEERAIEAATHGSCSTLGLDTERQSRRQLLKAGVILTAAAFIGAACGPSVEDKPLEERPQ